MTTVFTAVLACLVGFSLGDFGKRVGAHSRPHNPALTTSQDHNLFIPLPMVRNVRMPADDHGHYELDVETADGTRRTEVGDMDSDENNTVKGVIKYILPDGTPFVLRYIADETGFHPQGNMLPTPPPMPAHSLLQMKRAGMLHHSSEEDRMFDSMENDPMFKSMEHMFRSVEDDLINNSIEISTFKHNHPGTGQVIRFDSIEDVFDSPEDKFDSPEDKFDSLENKFDSPEDKFDSPEDKFDFPEDKFDSIEDKYDSIEDKFDSPEDKYDSIESKEVKRVPLRNRGNSRALFKNRANRRGVFLRNRNTGKIVLLRNRKIFDSFENDSLEFDDNTNETLEDNTLEDFSLENRTDERNSFESKENDSLEFNARINQSIRRGRRRFSTRV